MKNETEISKPISVIDTVEFIIANENIKSVNCPVTHRFTDGLYSREIFMPAGHYFVSKIHKFEHQFLISWGKVSVFTEDNEEVLMEAPFTGITKPGTRRLLYCHTDVLWTTFHPNPGNNSLDQLEEMIIEKNDNPFLTEDQKDFFERQSKMMSNISNSSLGLNNINN